MITEARREASRRNGRLGRGPTTAEGKALSSRNALRHGLSRPATLDPVFAEQIAALARIIAGPGAARERLDLALRIAAAQFEVRRVRRARAGILSAWPLDGATLARAVALDRYEARALSQRKCAIRQFDAAFPADGGIAYRSGFETRPPLASMIAGKRAGSKPAPTPDPEITWDASGYRYKGFPSQGSRTNPRYPRIFRAWRRPLEAIVAEQTRRARAAARLCETNPTSDRSSCIAPVSRPNAARAACPSAMRAGTRRKASRSTTPHYASGIPLPRSRSCPTRESGYPVNLTARHCCSLRAQISVRAADSAALGAALGPAILTRLTRALRPATSCTSREGTRSVLARSRTRAAFASPSLGAARTRAFSTHSPIVWRFRSPHLFLPRPRWRTSEPKPHYTKVSNKVVLVSSIPKFGITVAAR